MDAVGSIGEGRRTSQQLIENGAELVDVGESRDWITTNLLRRSVVRSHPAAHRVRERRTGIALWFEELGQAEIEQLYRTITVDENVRRLQIAVNYEVSVRVLRRVAYDSEKRD